MFQINGFEQRATQISFMLSGLCDNVISLIWANSSTESVFVLKKHVANVMTHIKSCKLEKQDTVKLSLP